jgi:hypothetical protein
MLQRTVNVNNVRSVKRAGFSNEVGLRLILSKQLEAACNHVRVSIGILSVFFSHCLTGLKFLENLLDHCVWANRALV